MSKLLFFELCCCLSELGFKLCTPLHHPRPFTNLNHVVWNCISVIFSCYSCVGTQSGSTRKGCLFFMGPKVTKPKVFSFFVFFVFVVFIVLVWSFHVVHWALLDTILLLYAFPCSWAPTYLVSVLNLFFYIFVFCTFDKSCTEVSVDLIIDLLCWPVALR